MPPVGLLRMRNNIFVGMDNACGGCSAAPASASLRRGIALVLDIKHAKRSDHALRESEERLRLAVESSALGVWEAHSPDGTLHFGYHDGTDIGMAGKWDGAWNRHSILYIRRTGHHSAIN